MKVLKRVEPTIDNDVMKQLCTGHGNGGNGCGSELQLDRADLRYHPAVGGGTWGSCEANVIFKCPVCGAATDLKTSEWPSNPQTLQTAKAAWINDRTLRDPWNK